MTPEEYREVIDQVILFLEGKQENLVQDLEKRMEQAARELRFEAAAKLRDQVKAIHQVMERQKIVTESEGGPGCPGSVYRGGPGLCTGVFVRGKAHRSGTLLPAYCSR